MKYFEVTFSVSPCNETATDILSALIAETGFESFVECEGGMQAYVQQSLFDEEAQGLERRMGKELLPTYSNRRQMCDTQHIPQGLSKG